jgi:small subunit ribosomal protein S6
VLRHLVVKMSGPVTTPSPMMKEEKARSVAQPAQEAAKPAAAPEPAAA